MSSKPMAGQLTLAQHKGTAINEPHHAAFLPGGLSLLLPQATARLRPDDAAVAVYIVRN